jgi:hypothetical protein
VHRALKAAGIFHVPGDKFDSTFGQRTGAGGIGVARQGTDRGSAGNQVTDDGSALAAGRTSD